MVELRLPYLDRRFDDLAHGISVTDAAIDGAGRAPSGLCYSPSVRELEGRSSPTDSTAPASAPSCDSDGTSRE